MDRTAGSHALAARPRNRGATARSEDGSDRSAAGGRRSLSGLLWIHGTPDRNEVLRGLHASVGMGLYQGCGLANRLGDRHPPAGAGHRPPRCHGGVEVSRYARVRGSWRRRATRRRSRRAASFATARRADQIIRSIMAGRTAHTVPGPHSVVFLEFSGSRHLRAEHGPSHHGLRDDTSRQGDA